MERWKPNDLKTTAPRAKDSLDRIANNLKWIAIVMIAGFVLQVLAGIVAILSAF